MKSAHLLLSAALILSSAGFTQAQSRLETGLSRSSSVALPVKLDEMPTVTRDAISKIMKSPTVSAVAPQEEFVAHPDVYQWLLDHPDRTSQAWRKLGVGAVEIRTLRDGRFFWKDDSGSELVWQSVARTQEGRIWYAEGKVKPGLLVPSVPVKAVAVINHSDKPRKVGDSVIKHQVEVFLQTDSKAAEMVTKMLGDNAPKMAKQGAEQLLMFFSGIARYAHDKPEKAESLFREKTK